MERLDPEEYDALTRIDFWVFVQRVFAELTGDVFDNNFHIERLCGEVDRVRTGTNIRLAIALPPRSLKSIIASVALPAWLLGHDPSIEIVCVSYGQELSDKLAADCRRIMLSPWYRRLFPAADLDRQAINLLATAAGGKRYSTSVGGALTGMGADVIIVDDPMKPGETASDAERKRANDWARHTLFTRLNNKANDRILIVMQRLHEDDMIGHVTDYADFQLLSFPAIAPMDELHIIPTPYGDWTHKRLAGEALHPSREPLAVLEKQRTLMGLEFFAAQYLQSPTPPGGGMVKAAWFGFYDPGATPAFTRIVQSWDCASKATQVADYSVCMTFGVTHRKEIYLLHVFRARIEYPELKRKIRELADAHSAGIVLIEDAAAGIQLLQELKHEGLYRLTAVKPRGDKVMRLAAQTPTIEAGRVFLPRGAPWLDDFLHELMLFPKGRHDDQVDSLSQALAYIGTPTSFDSWMEYMRIDALRSHGLEPEDLTVTFDSAGDDAGFHAGPTGRPIRREPDGFFHATPQEWESIRSIQGVRLVGRAA